MDKVIEISSRPRLERLFLPAKSLRRALSLVWLRIESENLVHLGAVSS